MTTTETVLTVHPTHVDMAASLTRFAGQSIDTRLATPAGGTGLRLGVRTSRTLALTVFLSALASEVVASIDGDALIHAHDGDARAAELALLTELLESVRTVGGWTVIAAVSVADEDEDAEGDDMRAVA